MQIQPTDSIGSSAARPLGDASGLAAVPGSARLAPVPPVAVLPAPGAAFAVRMQQNQKITDAQRSLAFLDLGIARLQALKSAISGQLSGNGGDSGVADKVAEFASFWGQRNDATGGSLDARLNLVGGGSARGRFRIAGLDMNSLLNGSAETLTFYPGGLAKPSVPVQLDAAMSKSGALARLNQGLAQLGIEAAADADGGLIFAAPESQLPLIREQMTVKGGGIRFPSGQPNRVNVEVVDQAVTPAKWKTDSPPALRQTLKGIVDVLGKLLQARQTAQEALADNARTITQARQDDDSQWADAFSSQFRDAMSRPDNYQVLSSIAPTVQGVTRHRVLALLALR